MQSIFENIGNPTKRNYLSAFVSFLMPLIWIFVPQLFEPLRVIESYFLGNTLLNAEKFTLDDITLISYFGIGCLIGIISVGFPNKKIPTTISATLGILINVFLLFGAFFEISMRNSDLQF